MSDRIIGILAFAALAATFGVLVGFVPSPDMVIVLAVVLAMAGYDFWRSLFTRGRG